jgi:hypothetical protein
MEKQRSHIVDVLFVLALFGVFALSALVLTSIGADVYRHTVTNMQGNYEIRTAASYLEEKVRRGDSPEIVTFTGAQALSLPETINGTTYTTLLYYHDGYLRELYMRADADLGNDILSAGQKITELGDMTLSRLSDSMIRVELTLTDGKTQSLLLHVYSD